MESDGGCSREGSNQTLLAVVGVYPTRFLIVLAYSWLTIQDADEPAEGGESTTANHASFLSVPYVSHLWGAAISMAFLSDRVRLDKALKDPRFKVPQGDGIGQLYEIRHIASQKAYIGLNEKTALYDRLYAHMRTSSGCIYIRNALQKHGPAAFTVQVIDSGVCTSKLPALECTRITERSALYPNGYNICLGGKTSPMHSEQVRAKQKATKETQESRMKQSKASREVQSRPSVIAKKRNAMIETCKTNKTKRSTSAKIAMNKPDVKEKHQKAMKLSHNTEEYRKNSSVAQKINQNRPEVAKKKGDAIRKAHSDPVVKEHHRAAIKKAFATPEARANRSAAQKAAWARKKALQAGVRGGQ